MTDRPNNTVALVTEDMLMAYVDGALDARGRLLVEHHLAAHPEAAERVAAYEEQDQALHALFDAYLAEPLPPEIEALTQRLREARPERPARRIGFLAASVAVLALVAGGGYIAFQSGFPGKASLAAKSQETGLSPKVGILPAGGALGAASALAPDLTGFGLSLTSDKALGASQLAGASVAGETRQLTYQNPAGQWMTLYISPSAPVSAGKAAVPVVSVQGQGISVLVWQSAGHAYSLIGSLPGDKLSAIASKIGEPASGLDRLKPLRDDRRVAPPSAGPTLDRPTLDQSKPERTSRVGPVLPIQAVAA